MKNPNYNGGPVTGYFVFDNKTDRMYNARLTQKLSQQDLIDMLTECLYYGIAESDSGARTVRYDFPDLDCIPQWSRDTADTYYPNQLRPALDEKGISAQVEVHSDEMLYCMLNSVPLQVGEPSESVRLRVDYPEQCTTFRERLPEIANKELRVLLPGDQEARIGLKDPAMLEELLRPKSVPAIPAQTHKQRI